MAETAAGARQGLAGKRLLVVGASAGIGRGVALRAIRAGARVVVAGRREAALAELLDEAGGGHAVAADVRAEAGAATIAGAARAELGQIDLMLVAAGASPLVRFPAVNSEQWANVLETNVVGIHRLLCACLPLLTPGALVGVLSSESVGEARIGLGAYAASKAALEQSLISWRGEHPEARFSTIVVGATFPTEFGRDFEEVLLGEALSEWSRRGQLPTEMMPTDDVADALTGVLAALAAVPSVGMDQIVLRSPTPPLPPF